jgi:hypothetical protein
MMTPVGGRDAIPRRWQYLGRPVISQPILHRPVGDVEAGAGQVALPWVVLGGRGGGGWWDG